MNESWHWKKYSIFYKVPVLHCISILGVHIAQIAYVLGALKRSVASTAASRCHNPALKPLHWATKPCRMFYLYMKYWHTCSLQYSSTWETSVIRENSLTPLYVHMWINWQKDGCGLDCFFTLSLSKWSMHASPTLNP